MDFFLEIRNGECGLGGHFCDHQRDHGPSVLIQPFSSRPECVSTWKAEVRSQSQEEEINQGESTDLARQVESF